jgi:hypothetical protein
MTTPDPLDAPIDATLLPELAGLNDDVTDDDPEDDDTKDDTL